jgi:hypothetical protein
MIVDRDLIFQVLRETKEKSFALLSMAPGKFLEWAEALFINLLAVIGVGVVSLATFIGYICGQVELGDAIPLD